MSDSSLPPMPEPTRESENKLTSEHFDALKEGLEVLYILANISGRIQFAQKWDVPAAYILGQELIRYDLNGTDNREHRATLEQEAEARRISLLELMDTIEEKSVEKGALRIDFVRRQVEKMGRDLALYVYGRKIVDRFIAPPPEPAPPVEDEITNAETTPEPEPKPKPEPVKSIAPDLISNEPLADVRPIDVSPPAAVAPPPTQKVVSMKFVSSKDRKDKNEPSE